MKTKKAHSTDELQKMLQEQSAKIAHLEREKEIEAALEQVRATAMAMQQSSELTEIAVAVFEQLKKLGLATMRCWVGNLSRASAFAELWFTSLRMASPHPVKVKLPVDANELVKKNFEAWKNGAQFIRYDLMGKDAGDFSRSLHKLTRDDLFVGDDNISYYILEACQKYGTLGVAAEKPISEEVAFILQRFAKVFELSYNRFLDLQRAEAQAREGQIQLALEKVRARAMGMHHSDELKELIGMVFTELTQLDLVLTRSIIWIIDPDTHSARWWMANSEEPSNPASFFIQYNEHPPYLAFIEAWKERNVRWEYSLEGVVKKDFDDFLFVETELSRLPEFVIEGMRAPERVILSASFNNFGCLQVAGLEALSDEHFDILLRFARVFELSYTRFNDLKQAEAQAREARIEVALERIRARSMAMHHSDELPETAGLMFEQLEALGFKPWACAFTVFRNGTEVADAWGSTQTGIMPAFTHPHNDDPASIDIYKAWKRGEALYVQEIKGKALAKHFQFMLSLTELKEMPQKLESMDIDLPTYMVMHAANFKQGYLIFNTLEPQPGYWDIFKRFAKVFEQTYTRFLDLQKAEAQAREAQIEAALERVRARTMAMLQSNELEQVVNVFINQIEQLGIDCLSCLILIPDEASFSASAWMANDLRSDFPMPMHMPFSKELPFFVEWWTAWENELPIFEYLFEGENFNSSFQYFFEETGFANFPNEIKSLTLTKDHMHSVSSFCPKAGLMINTDERLQNSDHAILQKFTKVFEQTYTRFLDLQKAEAQAREARIESALELVRTRTMGMHKSEELLEVSTLLFEQFLGLGIDAAQLNSLGIVQFDVEKPVAEAWVVWENGVSMQQSFQIPYDEDPTLKDMYAGWKRKEYYRVEQLTGKALEQHLQYMIGHVAPVVQMKTDSGKAIPTELVFYAAYFSQGYLAVASTKVLEEKYSDLFVRFAQVFEQTYTRFLDLKKAEAQTREAKIEAALERVRARSMAMHNSEELREVVALLYEQLNSLELAKHGCEIILCNEDKDQLQFWSANIMQAHLPERYDISRFLHPFFQRQWEAWTQQQECLVIALKGKEKRDFDQFILNKTDFQKLPDHVKEFIRSQKREVFTHATMKFGLLEAVDDEALPEDKFEVLKRFAIVFEQTYTRFLDLKTAEKQARLIREEKLRLEKTLQHLRAAQNQLIHAEKMASLGQLTAGIAHEIQNPLNFVNNFAGVSVELIEEMKEELQSGDADEAIELADLLIQNLEKITHHGQRADAIVKGMLQHSRSSDGKKEPTDINALAEEYLRLAYHGFRAKDKSFNLKMETDFDPSIGKINISPQEIGRVLLNLITNAFQACTERSRAVMVERDKKEAEDYEYEPLVSVITKNGEDTIELIVKDNGKGIPKEIQDKIFQPFFTNKPTGQGTGLGLSLAYDMVKAHQGELSVESTEGEEATFTIKLPK